MFLGALWFGTLRRTGAALLVLAVLSPTSTKAQALADSVMVAYFIDVGQGDAALLEFSCGAVMIDAGGQDQSDVEHLMAYLGERFAERPDLDSTIATVLVTHNHVDHTRALVPVVTTFRVRHVIEHGLRGGPGDVGDSSLVRLELLRDQGTTDVELVDIDDTDVIDAYGLTSPAIDPVACSGTDPVITVISADLAENPGWPKRAFANKNNHSLVVRVDFGAASFLYTGDLQEEAIETLVDFYADTPLLDTDVYQVGHHGSHNATTWPLLNAIDAPEIAVLSMGSCARNEGLFNAFRFGHPRADIVDMLVAAIRRRRSTTKRVPVALGVQDFRSVTMRDAVYATGWDGTVRVRATAGGRFRVTLERVHEAPEC